MFVNSLSLLFVTFLALLAYRLLSNYFNPNLKTVPGPVLARFSNLWRFIDSCKGRHELAILDLHRRYGPVVRIGPNAVSISEPAAVDEVLGFHANLEKSDQVKPMQNAYKGEPLPMLISAMDSKMHAMIRRPIAGAYSMTTLLGFEDMVDECITKMVRELETGYVEGCKSCLIDKWMHFFAFDFIGLATFSRPFGFLEGRDVDNMISILGMQFFYIAAVGNMPWLDYLLLKNPIILALVETPNPLVELARKCISERRPGNAEETANGNKDFLSRFLDAQDSHPGVVTDLQVAAYTATNVLAASDTTGSALTSIIWMVLRHGGVKEKLQKELEAGRLSYPVSYNEAKKLPYLDAVINETFRVFPTTGIELERKVGPAGLKLSTGHYFKSGTIVGVNPWPVHRNASVFGENVHDFVPERWLQAKNENREDFEKRRHRMAHFSLNFGHGPRGCLGIHVAYLQIYKTIATLFDRFDMALVKPNDEPKVRTTISVKIYDLDVNLRSRGKRN